MAVDELSPLTAALNGDQDAFERLVEPYRRELLVHCYRFLGALEDAEDMLQETLLRAWRGLHSYAGRAPFRAWLYKIATNVCLDALEGHRARVLPNALVQPGTPGEPLPAAVLDPIWLEPLPDSALESLLAGPGADPEAAYEARESVTLAFLALLQQLPGRQRAALILRDVLGFSADETAQMLDLSTAAVNSALQRARATMDGGGVRPAAGRGPTGRATQPLRPRLGNGGFGRAGEPAARRRGADHAAGAAVVSRTGGRASLSGRLSICRAGGRALPAAAHARQRRAGLRGLRAPAGWGLPADCFAGADHCRRWTDRGHSRLFDQ